MLPGVLARDDIEIWNHLGRAQYCIFSPIALVQTASLGSVVKRSIPPASKGQVVCAGEFFLLQIYSVTMFLACRGQHNRWALYLYHIGSPGFSFSQKGHGGAGAWFLWQKSTFCLIFSTFRGTWQGKSDMGQHLQFLQRAKHIGQSAFATANGKGRLDFWAELVHAACSSFGTRRAGFHHYMWDSNTIQWSQKILLWQRENRNLVCAVWKKRKTAWTPGTVGFFSNKSKGAV